MDKVLLMWTALATLTREAKWKFIKGKKLIKLKISKSKFHRIKKLCKIWPKIYFQKIILVNTSVILNNRLKFMMNRRDKIWMILFMGLQEDKVIQR